MTPKLDMPLLASPESAGAAARRIEEQGFDGTFSFEAAHDPFLPLALAARETERIEMGTAIAVAFARNPMLCAQVAQDLQRISNGRFWLGLGSQIRPHIERRFSQPWSKPADRMAEFVRAIRAIWHAWGTGERLDFRGEFYTHTLMTPFFVPSPHGLGDPPIHLAAVGPRMVEVAGEVADGLLIHPLHTAAFLEQDLLPALQRGLTRAGRARDDFTLSCQTLVMIGTDDAAVQRARRNARAQIAFYGSTPAYRVVLDREGWGDLQPELNRLSKAGRWPEMAERIGDDMLDAFGVSGTPLEVGRALRSRNARFERTALVVYDEAGPGGLEALVAGFREGPGGASPRS